MNTTAEVIAELKNMFAILLVRGRSDIFFMILLYNLTFIIMSFCLMGKLIDFRLTIITFKDLTEDRNILNTF